MSALVVICEREDKAKANDPTKNQNGPYCFNLLHAVVQTSLTPLPHFPILTLHFSVAIPQSNVPHFTTHMLLKIFPYTSHPLHYKFKSFNTISSPYLCSCSDYYLLIDCLVFYFVIIHYKTKFKI